MNGNGGVKIDNLNYSVSLLIESNNKEKVYIKNYYKKVFEESIVLVKLKEDFFISNSEGYILEYFRKNIPDFSYINEYGETIENKLVKVIEYYEIFNDIKFTDFTDVFSRFIIADLDDTPEIILKKYFGL